nr:hypothetical protein [uncultured Anaerosporobacter sp.]
MENLESISEEDGGYYAIKGFLYQFDKGIIELLSVGESQEIFIEHTQDINYQNYVLQIKHKETSKYSNSKIREPIIKLLEIYSNDTSKKFCLYAYFKDKAPAKISYSTIEDLKKVLQYQDKDKTEKLYEKYNDKVLLGFIKNFELIFSEDYTKQFKKTVELISEKWDIDDEVAVIYHSLIRNYLMNLAIKPDKSERFVTCRQLQTYISTCKNITFDEMYVQILGREKYVKTIKKQFFTFKSANINKYERLVIIECDYNENETEIRKLIEAVSHKFYRVNKSPAPYIVFRNLNQKVLISVKQGLLDDDILFCDGTCFDGDKFRMDKIKNASDKNGVVVKVFDERYLEEALSNLEFREIFNIFRKNKIEISNKALINNVTMKNLNEIIKVLE